MPPPTRKNHYWIGQVRTLWVCWLGLVLAALPTPAQETRPSEYELKAAFIYNFAKFVTWPPEAFPATDTPITIGIFGQNPFDSDLERITKDKTIEGRKLAVRSVKNLADLKNCQIVFISVDEKKRLREILDALNHASVLTVSDIDRFIENGGMINLVMEGKRVRFDIDNEAARRAGLKLSLRLLNLARNKPAQE